jgi:hypothetical protein
MYDVYVRGKCQFLVTRRGSPIPAALANGWRKKRAVRFVSDEIRKVVVREGFYARSQMSLIRGREMHEVWASASKT